MTCSQRGCAFPATKDGLCTQHLRLRDSVGRLPKAYIRDSADGLIPPRAPDRKDRREDGWAWSNIADDEAEIWATFAPKWGWLYKAAEDLAKGQCLKLDIPEGKDIKMLRKRVGTSVRAQFKHLRWRVRSSLDKKHIFVLKNGTWEERRQELLRAERSKAASRD